MNRRSIKGAMMAAALAAAVPCVSAQVPAEEKKDKPPMPAAAGAPAMPKPAAEMAAIKYFEGKWSCTGEGSMEPGGPTMKTTATVKVDSDLGGFWQMGKVTAQGSAPGAPPFEGKFHTTWDSAGKQYVMLWVDSMGGWSETRATGWDGDKIVYAGSGYMGGHKFGSRDTFTKKADGSMVHLGELEMGGKWMKMQDEICMRVAKKDK